MVHKKLPARLQVAIRCCLLGDLGGGRLPVKIWSVWHETIDYGVVFVCHAPKMYKTPL